jgi:hypothetical protein
VSNELGPCARCGHSSSDHRLDDSLNLDPTDPRHAVPLRPRDAYIESDGARLRLPGLPGRRLSTKTDSAVARPGSRQPSRAERPPHRQAPPAHSLKAAVTALSLLPTFRGAPRPVTRWPPVLIRHAGIGGPLTISSAALHESHVLLDRARLVSESPAAQVGQIGSGGHPSSRPPPFRERSTLDRIGDRMNDAIATDIDSRLRFANSRARSELDLIQHGDSRRIPETLDQRDYRIGEDYVGRSAQYVADRERMTEGNVRAIRVKLGLDRRGIAVTA